MRHAMRAIHWGHEFAVLAVRYGDRVAVCDERGEVSYSEIFAKATAAGQALVKMGVRPGDAVATLFRNGRDAVSASYGVTMSGAVEVPLNPALGPADLQYGLELSGTHVVLTSADLAVRLAASDRPVLSMEEI